MWLALLTHFSLQSPWLHSSSCQFAVFHNSGCLGCSDYTCQSVRLQLFQTPLHVLATVFNIGCATFAPSWSICCVVSLLAILQMPLFDASLSHLTQASAALLSFPCILQFSRLQSSESPVLDLTNEVSCCQLFVYVTANDQVDEDLQLFQITRAFKEVAKRESVAVSSLD